MMQTESWLNNLNKKERALIFQIAGALDLPDADDFENLENFLLTLRTRVNTIRGILIDAKSLLGKIK